MHVLSLPPAFVLSQDQTLKLSLEPARSERTPTITAVVQSQLRLSTELELKETSAAGFLIDPLPEKLGSARAPPPTFLFLNKPQCQRACRPHPQDRNPRNRRQKNDASEAARRTVSLRNDLVRLRKVRSSAAAPAASVKRVSTEPPSPRQRLFFIEPSFFRNPVFVALESEGPRLRAKSVNPMLRRLR